MRFAYKMAAKINRHTLARPAAPLVACVQRMSSVDNNIKNWLPWQRPSRDQKLFSD